LTIPTSQQQYCTTTAVSPRDWVLPGVDNSGTLRSINMSKTDGSFVCPVGFRVPTIAEINAELINVGSALISNRIDAFDSFLKLPSAGYRGFDGVKTLLGAHGNFWASNSVGTSGEGFKFDAADAYTSAAGRGLGRSIRCIKN